MILKNDISMSMSAAWETDARVQYLLSKVARSKWSTTITQVLRCEEPNGFSRIADFPNHFCFFLSCRKHK